MPRKTCNTREDLQYHVSFFSHSSPSEKCYIPWLYSILCLLNSSNLTMTTMSTLTARLTLSQPTVCPSFVQLLLPLSLSSSLPLFMHIILTLIIVQFAFRAVALGYCVSTIISNFVYTDSYTFFTFFTNLSYMILVIYFGFMVYLSVHYNDYTKVLSDNKLRAVCHLIIISSCLLPLILFSMFFHYLASLLSLRKISNCTVR